MCVNGSNVFVFGGLNDNSFMEAHLGLIEITLS